MNQHLNSRLGLVQLLLNGKTFFVERARPEITGDGEQMWITEQRNKRVRHA